MSDVKAKLITKPIRAFTGLATKDVLSVARLVNKPIQAEASLTDKTGIRYLRVEPEEPQVLMWMVQGNIIEYKVYTNLEWRIFGE